MNAQLPSLDKISNLPSSIIENILCLVPIKEAARTSILSKEWRYKWITIPKLVFNENLFELSTNDSQESEKMNRCKFFYAIYQVLFVHQGPILDFTLEMVADKTCYEIDQIIKHLSRMNTVKRLKLSLSESYDCYKLPLSIFSLHQLTHLYLYNLDIHHQPPFNGYGNLTKLHLSDVNMPPKTLLHLLSSCPLLKTLTLHYNEKNILGDKSTVIELFKCLSVLENLTTWTWLIECFDLGPVPRELPFSLVNLKYLCVKPMCLFTSLEGFRFLVLLIKSSPNLVKLQLGIYGDSATDRVVQKFYKKNPIKLDEYSDICLEHLNQLELGGFFNLKLLLDFVKLILSKSPMLKKVRIWLHDLVTKDEESNICEVLKRSPHASPEVEIMVERYD